MTYKTTITAHSNTFRQWPRGIIIIIYISMMMLLKQLSIWVLLIKTKFKKYWKWIRVRSFAILELVLIVWEFNVQCINRSVCEFWALIIRIRMHINEAYHHRNQENWFWEIVISENNWNHIPNTFISMRIDAEHNETAPAISDDRLHGNICILTTMTSNYDQKVFWINRIRWIRKGYKTDMESPTF